VEPQLSTAVDRETFAVMDILKPSEVVWSGGGVAPQWMVSGPEFSRENRIKHVMKLNKSFLAVELLEGFIGDWVIQVGASQGQSVGGYPAPGD